MRSGWPGGRFRGRLDLCGSVTLASLIAGIGYIGAKLAEDLLAAGETVVGLDNLFSSDEAAIRRLQEHPRFAFVRGSILSPTALERAFAAAGNVETLYLLAAQSSANPAAASPRYTEAVNLLGPRRLLDAARAAGVKRVVFASSMHVYGAKAPWLAEEVDLYGAFADLSHLSKAYVEKLCEMYALEGSGLGCIAVRLGLTYGLSPVMKIDARFMTAPNKFCLQAVRGEPITVNESGLRPFALIHVADAARALRHAAAICQPQQYLAANAAPEVASIAEVAQVVATVARRHGLSPVINLPPGPGSGDAERGPVPSRLADTGFRPTRNLREGLEEVLAYFRDATAKERGS